MSETSDLVEATPAQAGFITYATLAAVGRMGKDSTMAPSVSQSLQLERMISTACHGMSRLREWAAARGESFEGIVGAFYGNVNDLESRLRPADWWERLLKSYVTIGLFADLAKTIGQGTDLERCHPAMTDFGYREFAQPQLLAHVEAEPTESARLSLWGRRVFGETLGLANEGLTLRFELGVDAVNALSTTMKDLGLKHEARMEAAGLAG